MGGFQWCREGEKKGRKRQDKISLYRETIFEEGNELKCEKLNVEFGIHTSGIALYEDNKITLFKSSVLNHFQQYFFLYYFDSCKA